MMKAEMPEGRAGRITFKGKPLGLWWKTEAGTYASKTALGDFSGATLEALIALVESAYIERVRKAFERKAQAEEKLAEAAARRGLEASEERQKKPPIAGGFGGLLLLYAFAMRGGWPASMALALGPSALLALSPALLAALIASSETAPAAPASRRARP
jgi:hypothetical protein